MERLSREHGAIGTAQPLYSTRLLGVGREPDKEPNCQPPAQGGCEGGCEGGPEVSITGRPAAQGSFAFPGLPDVSAASGQGWGPDDPLSVAPGSLQSR